MKWLQKITGFLVCAILCVPLVAGAVDIGVGAGGQGMTGEIANQAGYQTMNVTDTSLSETIGRIVRSVLSVLGTIFFVLTVYAGVLWMTSAGNAEQVEKATGILRASVIGLIIVFAAYSITVFVMHRVMSASA